MKNKLLRLTIVVVLAVSMVLTLAACGGKVNPTPTPTPSPSTSPSDKPTVSPSDSTSPKPTTDNSDQTSAKDDFGIEFVGVNGVFSGNPFYIVLKGDITKINLNDYTLHVKVDSIDYTGDATSGMFNASTLKNLLNTDTVGGSWTKVYLQKDGTYSTTPSNLGEAIGIPVTHAGQYDVAITVTVKDNGSLNSGKFGVTVDEDKEYELVARAEIGKSVANILIADKVDKIDASITSKQPIGFELFNDGNVGGVGASLSDKNFYLYVDGKEASVDATAALALQAFKGEFLAGGVKAYIVEQATFSPNTVSQVALGIYYSKAAKSELTQSNMEDKRADMADAQAVNFTFVVTNAVSYFISAVDFEEIRDVATSIAEVRSGNEAQFILAKARYDALSQAQKAYFLRYNVVSDDFTAGFNPSEEGDAMYDYYNKYFGSEIAEASTPYSVNLMLWLTMFQPTANTQAKVLADFVTAIEKTSFSKFMNAFNVDNATHVASFKAAEEYFNSLSQADKAVLTANLTSTENALAKTYTEKLNGVSALFLEADVNAVKQLIAGALAAFDKAIANDAFVVYNATNSGVTVLKFINSKEVNSLVAQSYAAYEKLSAEQKAEIAKADAVTSSNLSTDAKVSYHAALTAMNTMTKVVVHMEEVINYVNIQDYFHLKDTTPVYSRLTSLVFGTGENFFGESNENFAMQDVLEAFLTAPRHMANVIAEYKGWIEVVLEIEKVKKEVISEFDQLIAEEFTLANGYDEIKIANATGKTNADYKQIVAKIMNENDATFAKNALTLILSKSNVETFEEIKEYIADAFNVDKAFQAYLKAINA